MYDVIVILAAGYFVALFQLFRMIYRFILFLLLIYVVTKLIRKSYKKVLIAGTILFVLAAPEG